MRLLPRRSRRNCAPTRSDYCRRNAIFHRRACIGQISISAIQLVGHIAAYGADPAVIKAADIELLPICERDDFCRLINPEAKILFGAR